MTLPTAISAHPDRLHALGFGADPDQIVTAGADGSIKQWDISTDTLLRNYIGHTASVVSLVVIREFGELLSGGQDRTVNHWLLSSGKRTNAYRGHSKAVADIATSSTNKQFVTAGQDGAVLLWRIGHLTPQRMIAAQDGPIRSLDYSDSGSLLAVGPAADRIDIFETESWTRIRQLSVDTESVRHVRFRGDDELIIVGSDGFVSVRDILERGTRFSFRLEAPGELPMAMTSGGDMLYLGVGGAVQPVDLTAGTRLDRIRLPVTDVTAVAVSSEADRLAIGSATGELRVRSLQDTSTPFSSR